MAKENNVNINFVGKTDSLDKAVDKAGKSLDNLGKKGGKLENLAKAGSITSGIDAFTNLVGKAIDAVNELTDAYNSQKEAETQLETAARNNPYMNGDSVARLREYAAEMQRVTNVSDEEILSQLARLAAQGRTEAEAMDVVSASLDVAASGAMSFESAVSNLSKTFSGLAGELGESVPQVRALTTEQLKNGEAVKVIAQQYAGMAENVAESTGGARKFSNAVKSMKEELGAMFSKATEPMKNFFGELIQNWADAKRAKREYEETQIAEEKGYTEAKERAVKGSREDAAYVHRENIKEREAEIAALQGALDDQAESFATTFLRSYLARFDAEMQAEIDKIKSAELSDSVKQNKIGQIYTRYNNIAYKTAVEEFMSETENTQYYTEQIAKKQEEIANISKELARVEAQITAEKEKQAEEARKAAEEAARAEADAKALNAMKGYREKVAAAEEEIRVRRELGEEITRQAELEEMAAVKTSAAIAMIEDAEGTISTENWFFKEVREDIAGMSAELAELEDAAEAAAALQERIQSLKESVSGAEGGGAPEWKEASDSVLSLAEELESLSGALPEEEASEIRARIAEIRAALLSPQEETEELALSKQLFADADAMEQEAADLEIRAKEAAVAGKLDLEKEYLANVEALRELSAQKIAEAEEQALKESNDRFIANFESVVSTLNSITGTLGGALDLLNESSETTLNTRLAELEAAFNSGAISEEEYEERVTEAKRKAAKEQYRIQMWQWTANMIQAAAGVAMGIIQAMNSPPPANYINMGLVAAAGAVQMAAVTAAKPVPPSFSTGGIVGGTSYYGDRVQAHLNSREMVLNLGQQKNLFDAINAGGMAGGVNVVVNNSASNLVRAEPRISRGQIELLIDARVNESMQKGRYTNAMTQAQQGAGGKYYGI